MRQGPGSSPNEALFFLLRPASNSFHLLASAPTTTPGKCAPSTNSPIRCRCCENGQSRGVKIRAVAPVLSFSLQEMSQFYACVFWCRTWKRDRCHLENESTCVCGPVFDLKVKALIYNSRKKRAACWTVRVREGFVVYTRPWDVMMMLFNELYTMLVPLLVPDRHWVVPDSAFGARFVSLAPEQLRFRVLLVRRPKPRRNGAQRLARCVGVTR